MYVYDIVYDRLAVIHSYLAGDCNTYDFKKITQYNPLYQLYGIYVSYNLHCEYQIMSHF